VQLRYQWHSLNPVVREISLARLKEDLGEFKTAHSLAAEHHLRHFRAKNVVLDHPSLTSSYAELRYHLFHAGRMKELRDVALRLCDHFKATWSSTSPVPQDRAELDERIGVLTALLQDGGPKSLEYYLARCLQTRGTIVDLQEALVHVTRATEGRAAAAVWLLRAGLHKDLGDREGAIQAILDAVRIVDPGDAIGTLYGFGGRLLAEQGNVDDAVKLLRSGILKVPPSKNLFSLYQSAAELLGQAGKTDEAVILLKEGIKVIPADQNIFFLYKTAAELLGKVGNIDGAAEYLRAGILSATRSGGLVFHLYQKGAEFLVRHGRRQAAIDLLRECIREVPGTRNSLSVFKAAAALLADQGQFDEALELLEKGRWGLASGLRQVDLFYRTKVGILTRAGRIKDAQECIENGLNELRPGESAFLHQLAETLKARTGEVDGEIDTVRNGDLSVTRATCTKVQDALNAQGLAAGETPAPLRDSTSHRPQQEKNFLVFATEWESSHGGLSTFNRLLCRALVSQGHKVVCVVPGASETERQNAASAEIELVVAAPVHGSDELSGLLRPLALPTGFTPHVIVGHGRITGGAARAQHTDHFPSAKRVHFVHMAPGEIEWFKTSANRAATSSGREQIESELAADADLVAAVGPRLWREFSDLMLGVGSKTTVVEFVPAPVVLENGNPPQLNHCLVLGRMDDYELKGLDIAAKALGHVLQAGQFVGESPQLILRGAAHGTADGLRERLMSECVGADLFIRVREYDSNEDSIDTDLRRAVLLLMPSRSEGFGLVALEAISRGVPVLVSDKSGFGEIVRRFAPEGIQRNAVVATPQDADEAAKNWASAIGMQLLDKVASFARARELGSVLANSFTWDAEIAKLIRELGLDREVD